MAKHDFNRTAELETFVKVVEHNGFTAAANALDTVPSSVSRSVAKLEKRLGVRLFNRSTRSIHLTSEGCDFYERVVRILSDLNEAEQLAGLQKRPTGKIRVNCNSPFGKHYILPLVPEFQEKYPEVTLDIELSDHVVNLLEESADVAIRSGSLSDSSLVSRKLGKARMVIVAAPSYIAKHGTPESAGDLRHHNLLGFTFRQSHRAWPLNTGGFESTIMPAGTIRVSDGDALRQLVLSGSGIARLAYFQVKNDIAKGDLVLIMEKEAHSYSEEVQAVYVGHTGILPVRIRAFIDFLVEKVKVE